jgi:DNA polymerase-1
MIKLAMVKIHQAFKEHNFKGKMILQVHDELVFDVPNNEVEKVKPVILECMQSAMILPNNVPVLAEVGTGSNWLEAH